MRYILPAFVLFVAGATPALANGAMRQSPALMRKAGASCTPGHRGPQRGAGYRYQLGGCAPSER